MSSVGKISLDLNVNSKNFNKQVDGIQKQTTKAFGMMSVAVGNVLSNMLQSAISNIGHFVKDSINKGSELAELQNVVDSVFTTMADKVEDFSKSALENFGLTESQSKKMVGTYGAMSKAFGYTEQQAFDMSTALTGLTADVASFYNLDHDVAYTKLKSVFTGETESLKELGVVMTQAALDQFALSQGFSKTTKDMSEQEKVALRFAFVQDKLSVASGDFLKTQDQWANQTRILAGQFDSLKAALGQGFINVLTPLVRTLNVVMTKLVQAANLFKDFTAQLMGVKSSSGAGSAMMEVADAADSAASSTGGIENAANGAAKAAKEAKKALMGFDEINKLSPNSSSGSGSDTSGAMIGGIENIGLGEASEEAKSTTFPVLEGIKSKLMEIIDLFKSGFSSGLGEDFEASLARVQEHAKSIGDALKEIFTDSNVEEAASNWVNSLSYALGQASGSIVSIVQTIAELIVGGIDNYLTENKERIKGSLVNILNVSAEYWAIAGDLTEAVASIFEVFRGDTAKEITGDLISIVANASLGMAEMSLKIGSDVINCIAQPIIENKDLIKDTIQGTLEPVGVIVDTLANSVTETFDRINTTYDEKISPMFQSFADGMSALVTTLLTAYNEHIKPVLDKWGQLFKDTFELYIQPAINSIIDFVGKVANAIKVLWDEVLQPLIDWIIETIVPVIAPIIETLGNYLMALLGVVSQVVGGIFEALGGLIDFIVGVFTGDWELAWEGIKSIFSGVWNAIEGIVRGVWETIKYLIEMTLNIIIGIIKVSLNAIKLVFTTVFNVIKNVVTTVVGAIKTVISNGFNGAKNAVSTAAEFMRSKVESAFSAMWSFMQGIINKILGGIESMVNGVVSGVNKITSALNSLNIEVPDWVPGIGGSSLGFDIPKINKISIPKMAEGGYLKANQPTLAMVGDNKTQGEIVSPEGKMHDVMMQALEAFFTRLMGTLGLNQGGDDAGDIVIPIYLDGTLLDEVIVTAQQRRSLRSGGM